MTRLIVLITLLLACVACAAGHPDKDATKSPCACNGKTELVNHARS